MWTFLVPDNVGKLTLIEFWTEGKYSWPTGGGSESVIKKDNARSTHRVVYPVDMAADVAFSYTLTLIPIEGSQGTSCCVIAIRADTPFLSPKKAPIFFLNSPLQPKLLRLGMAIFGHSQPDSLYFFAIYLMLLLVLARVCSFLSPFVGVLLAMVALFLCPFVEVCLPSFKSGFCLYLILVVIFVFVSRMVNLGDYSSKFTDLLHLSSFTFGFAIHQWSSPAKEPSPSVEGFVNATFEEQFEWSVISYLGVASGFWYLDLSLMLCHERSVHMVDCPTNLQWGWESRMRSLRLNIFVFFIDLCLIDRLLARRLIGSAYLRDCARMTMLVYHHSDEDFYLILWKCILLFLVFQCRCRMVFN